MKKLSLVAITAFCVVNLYACQDTSWVYEYGDTTVTPGLYIAYQIQMYSSAQMHEDVDFMLPLMSQNIEGVSATVYINEQTRDAVERYIAIEYEFDRLGLSFSEQDLIEINEMVAGFGEVQSFYEQNGVGLVSYEKMAICEQKAICIFKAYYAEGGTDEVPTSVIDEYFDENYAAINVVDVVIEKEDDMTEEQIAVCIEEARIYAQAMANRINNDGSTFNDSVDIYVRDRSGFAEDEALNAYSVDDASTISYVQKGSYTTPQAILDVVFDEMNSYDGKAHVIEVESSFYVVVRYDILEDEEKLEEYREGILYEVQADTFIETIESVATDISSGVIANDASIKRYSPDKIEFYY